MALSNWDTIAWNEKGEPTKGVLECPDGVKVKIYKNWVSIQDDKAWREGPFVKPYIISFWDGFVQYRNLYLFGKRSIQVSVFLAAIYKDWSKNITRALFGIGCYGFVGDKWVGVKYKTIHLFRKWLMTLPESSYFPLDKNEIPEFKEYKRYNQGDLYLANELGLECPQTEPERPTNPILCTMLGTDCIKKEDQ